MDFDFAAEPAHVTLLGLAGVGLLFAAVAWLRVAKACHRYAEHDAPMNRGTIFKELGGASTVTGVVLLVGLAGWLIRGY